MKVVHIIATLDHGGAESALYRLITNDNDNEHQVICLSDADFYGTRLIDSGFKVSVLNMRQIHRALLAPFTLTSILRKEQPDIIQTWMYHSDVFGGTIARLVCRAKVVWGIRVANIKNVRYGLMTRTVVKASFLLSKMVPHHIISCAETAKDQHILGGYPAGRMSVVANGYDFNWLHQDAQLRRKMRSEWPIPDSCFVIGMVGRWHPQKNHACLLRALAMLLNQSDREIKLVLVGPDIVDSNAELQLAIEQYDVDDHVLLLGERSDIPNLYNAMDLHVLPSLDEGFPNVVAEAMCCGTPCIASDVGDAAIIIGECGWVVPPNNTSALVDALSEAVAAHRDDKAWGELQHNSRESILERYSLQSMADGFGAVWNTLYRQDTRPSAGGSVDAEVD